MKTPFGKNHPSAAKRFLPRSGFALVVTLSLMILLTVVAVGLLSLASISLRSSSQSADLALARGNARMALMLAVGDLQKTAGKDTRVTARADLLDENNPPVLGVWKSWEGVDHDNNGRPVAPDYSDHKSARFVAWLTSASRDAVLNQMTNTKAGAGKVSLLGEKSVGTLDPDRRQVHLTPTDISLDKLRGSYAWWVSGENQKVRLPRPYAPATDNAATWSVLAKTHGSVDTAPFGLDGLLKDASLTNPAAMAPASKALSIKQGDLLGAVVASGSNSFSRENYHDVSTSSIGLLTNVNTGGWRKDLSLMTENWDSLSTSGLPFFRVSANKDLMFTRPESDPLSPKSILYYWSDYRRGATGNVPIYSFPAISSWANLAKYATIYKDFSATSATSVMSTEAQAAKINGSGSEVYDFIHKVRILPVIARVQWIFSHKAVANSAFPGKYDLKLVVTPVFTLWNPYNVRISTTPNLNFSLQGSLPPVIEYNVGGTALPKKITLQTDRIAPTTSAVATGLTGITNYTLTGIPAFAPGETRVFSPKDATNTLVAGYTPGGGVAYTVLAATATTPGATGKISTAVTFDSEYNDAGATGVGLYLNMDSYGSTKVAVGTVLAYRMSYQKSLATTAYPALPSNKLPAPSVAEVSGPIPTPFLSITFGARMASNTHLPSKGFVQSSPFVNYTAMGQKGPMEPTIQYSYPGTLHNVNSPFEYSFQGLTGPGLAYLPEVGTDNRGFILTGFKASNGLSRCVISELPGRPLNSLAELQNWDARYENPVPPYSYNLIGNSDASPLLPPDAVVNSTDSAAKGAENLQNDDSYCLNHVLFDDWFFSSITPEPAAFGKPSVSSTSKVTYANFLRDPSKPLANRAYKALQQDAGIASISAAKANDLATKYVGNASTSWKTIASRLEVEGMFNVNSTSVRAWRALLGHARDQRIPYIGASGNTELSGTTQYAVSRFSVAGDVESKKAGASGALPESAEYAGYRVYTEAQLDFLAKEIVGQVRLRGPFLSLSEFVNRQLSTNKDLAIAGAIQTALNKLTANASQNPFSVLQKDTTPGGNGSNLATVSPPGGSTGYQFPEAAAGYNIYGIPGWTRQADVLRPLAPVLSARDDTFTIRAYGDAREIVNQKIVIKARAVCEATIRRSREFVDQSDDSASSSVSNSAGTVPTPKAANQLFGRRFEIVTFRWLSPDEI